MLGMRTCLPCHIPDRRSRNANWIWPDLAFGYVHKRSGNEINAGELGTTRASINRTGKTTASKGIGKKYNEYKEVHERETEAHICPAFMEMAGMEPMHCKSSLISLDTIRGAYSSLMLIISRQSRLA